MTFRLLSPDVLNVAFVALYHINEIGRRTGDDVMSYRSLFIGGDKRAGRGSLCNKRTRIAAILL